MFKIFFFSLLSLMTLPALAQQDSTPMDCRAQIAKIVCLVDKATYTSDDDRSFMDRPCLPGTENYIAFFEGHYDRSDAVIQKMYCHMARIFVEKSLEATAYASLAPDVNGKVIGGAVGIRQELLDHPMEHQRWLSWKEETSFGGSPSPQSPSLDLIHYQSSLNTFETMLDFTLDHEFGHLFDFANHLNSLDDCKWQQDGKGGGQMVGACTATAGSWTSLSWATIKAPLAADDYPMRSQLCFYFCNGHFIAPADAVVLFSQLMNTNFVSTYASWNMYEDWAENFAYYLMTRERGLGLTMETGGTTFDLTGHFNSSLLDSKRAYVENFLNKPYYYPGENPAPARIRRIMDR